MKKVTILIVLIMCLTLVLSGCKCTHENWTEADCTTPKTCEKCGETEGDPKGHDWKDATCEEPKTCKDCDATEGSPLGHVWDAATCDAAKTCQICKKTDGEPLGHNWTDATCLLPKTCDKCKQTEGEALGHSWLDATTEAPKTCETCGETEGERIITDSRFTTNACSPYFGTWSSQISYNGDYLGIEGFAGKLDTLVLLQLNNDGTMQMNFSPTNTEEFNQQLIDHMVDELYAEFALDGIDKAQADALMKDYYGMTAVEYMTKTVKDADIPGSIADLSVDGVYYVDGSTLYTGQSWSAMLPEITIVDESTLRLEDFVPGVDLEDLGDLIFTRQ